MLAQVSNSLGAPWLSPLFDTATGRYWGRRREVSKEFISSRMTVRDWHIGCTRQMAYIGLREGGSGLLIDPPIQVSGSTRLIPFYLNPAAYRALFPSSSSLKRICQYSKIVTSPSSSSRRRRPTDRVSGEKMVSYDDGWCSPHPSPTVYLSIVT